MNSLTSQKRSSSFRCVYNTQKIMPQCNRRLMTTWLLHTQQHGGVWLTARESATDVIVGLCNQGGILGDIEYKRRAPRLVTYKAACRSTMLAISKESFDLAFVNHRDPLRRFQAAAEVSLPPFAPPRCGCIVVPHVPSTCYPSF